MCEINRRSFVGIISDNDEVYLLHLCGIIESVDEYASIEITNSITKYHFRIAPSAPKYINHLVREITRFSNMFKIRLNMSKSMKSSSTVTFDIELN